MSKIILLPPFQEAIEQKFETINPRDTWGRRGFNLLFATCINDFINDEDGLKQMDEALQKQVIREKGMDYPSAKTIYYAFSDNPKGKTIDILLLDVCGWWLYEEKWTEKRVEYFDADFFALNIQKTEDTQDVKDDTRSALWAVFETNNQLKVINTVVENALGKQAAAEQYKTANEILNLSNSYLSSVNKVDRVFDKGRFIYIYLKDLYVHRSVEQQIIKRILDTDPSKPFTIIVRGEAGRGKTSLLWHWARYFKPKDEIKNFPFEISGELKEYEARLREEWSVYQNKEQYADAIVFDIPETLRSYRGLYLKSTDLHPSSSAIEDIVDKIIATHQYFQHNNQRLLLLIDTLDLLVQLENGITAIETAFHKFRMAGIPIICTSRIQEARLIHNKIHNPIAVEIQDYDERELKDAIFKHTRKYAYRYSEADIEREYHRIISLVDKGLPIKEVCYNPLTFRMLYSIYMPNSIPDNVNIHELYKIYWERKVNMDFRPGIDDVDEIEGEVRITPRKGKDIDLSRLVYHLALMMLFKGKIELKYQQVLTILEKKKIPKDRVILLADRDIIDINQKTNTIGFFHQTFFEFASAKSFVHLDDGFTLFKNYIQQHTDNLFLLPIYEQLLLLSENSPFYDDMVPIEVMRLLKSNGLSENYSAIYVYTLLTETKPAFSQSFTQQLIQKEAIIAKYFELIPNTNKQRLPILFEELATIYPIAKNKPLGMLYLDILRRFAGVNQKLVHHFLVTYHIHKLIPLAHTIANKLFIYIEIIATLLEMHYDWAIEHFIGLIQLFPTEKKVHQKIYQLIYTYLSNDTDKHIAKIEHIATRLSGQLATIYESNKKETPAAIVRIYAQLWILQWGKGKMEQIILDRQRRLLDIQKPFEYKCKLFALAELTPYQTSERLLQLLLNDYQALPNSSKTIWMRAYLNNVLQDPNLPTKASRIFIPFVQKIIRTHLEVKNNRDFEFLIGCFEIRANRVPDKLFYTIFSIPELKNQQIWLDKSKKFWQLLMVAYKAQCEGAVAALNTVIEQHNQKKYAFILKKIEGYLGYRNTEQKSVTLLTDILQKFSNYEGFIRVLMSIDIDILKQPTIFTNVQSTLNGLLTHKEIGKRKLGTNFYLYLLKTDLVDFYEFKVIEGFLSKASDAIILDRWIQIISRFYPAQDFEGYHRLLTSYIQPKHHPSDNRINYYIDFLLQYKANTPKYLDLILNLILSRTNQQRNSRERLKKWNSLIFNLLKMEEITLAFKVATQFFSILDTSYFIGQKSQRQFARDSQRAIFRLLASLTEQQQLVLIDYTPSLPIKIGEELLRAIYQQDLQTPALQERINALKQLTNYPTELKAFIDENEYILTRINGVEEWKALSHHIVYKL